MPLGRIYTGGSTAKVARPVVHGFDLASMNDNHHREFKLKLGKVQAMAISGDTSGALQEAAQAEKALALRMDVMKEVIHEEEVKMTARAGTPRNAAPTPPPLLGKKGSVGRVQNSGIALGRAMPSGADAAAPPELGNGFGGASASFIAGGGGDEDGRTSRASGALAGARIELAEAAQELNEMHQIVESLRDSAAPPSPATPAKRESEARAAEARAALEEEVRAQLTHRIMEAEAAPATPLARVSMATETSTAAENGPKQGWLKRASSSGTALGTELRSSVPVERGADAVAVLLKKQLEVEYELEHMRGLLSSLPSFNLYSLFKAIDKNGKGHLTRADFESMMTKHRLAPTADTMAGIWDYFSPTGDGSVSYMDFSSRLLPRGAGVDELRQLMSPIPSTLYGAQLSASVEGALVAALLQKAKLGAELKRAQRAIGEGEALEAAQRELDPKKVGHVPLTALHNFMAAHEQWLGYSDLKAIFDKFASPTHPGELSVNRFLDGLTEAWTLSAGKEHAFDEMTLGAPKKASLGMSPAKIPASARKKMGGRTKTEAVTARKESVESRNASGRASISGRHGSTASAEEEAAIAACAAATGSAYSQARPAEALPGYGHGGSGSGAAGGATPRTYASRVARATFTNKGLATPASAGLMGGMETPYLAGGVNTGDRASGALARARAQSVPQPAARPSAAQPFVLQMPTVGEAAAPKPAAAPAPAPALISGAHGDATPRTAARQDRVGRARAATVYRAQNVAPAFGRNHPGEADAGYSGGAPGYSGATPEYIETSSKPEMPRRESSGMHVDYPTPRAPAVAAFNPTPVVSAVANAGLTPRRVGRSESDQDMAA